MAGGAGSGGFDPVSTIDGRRHRITLGLRRLDLADWLLVDEHADAEIAHKRQLLAADGDEVLRTMPAGDEAADELLTEIVANLSAHHPARSTEPEPALHPVHAAALLVQEDLCIMTREAQEWTMTSACVCFPSRWRLADKIGASVAAIHAPVPDYDQISAPVDLLFERLTPERPMWRVNWTLMDDPALHQPSRPATTVEDPGSWTFRVERQTLRRLPHTGAAVFTIRTYRRRLADLVIADPAAAAALATTLTTVTPDQREYRAWDELPALVSWLRAQGDISGLKNPG